MELCFLMAGCKKCKDHSVQVVWHRHVPTFPNLKHESFGEGALRPPTPGAGNAAAEVLRQSGVTGVGMGFRRLSGAPRETVVPWHAGKRRLKAEKGRLSLCTLQPARFGQVALLKDAP